MTRAAERGPGRTGCQVTVCRGCCCGTERKHPTVDHAAQVQRLRVAVGAHGSVRITDCLDACGESNVVVVQPSPAGRARRGRPTWLAWVNDDDAVADIESWLAAGGPGLAPIPATLELHTFTPPRRAAAPTRP